MQNTGWSMHAPAAAGESGAFHSVPDDYHVTGLAKPFSAFMKRADGWEYLGTYRRCIEADVLESYAPPTADKRHDLVPHMLKSEYGRASIKAEYGSATEANARKLLDRDKFWTSVPVEFVGYDEGLYEYLVAWSAKPVATRTAWGKQATQERKAWLEANNPGADLDDLKLVAV